MTEGYMALCVSILRNVPPEKAFRLLGNRKPYDEKKEKPRKKKRQWGMTEIMLMDIMRKNGLSWDEIGKRFGITGKHARSLVSFRLEGK